MNRPQLKPEVCEKEVLLFSGLLQVGIFGERSGFESTANNNDYAAAGFAACTDSAAALLRARFRVFGFKCRLPQIGQFRSSLKYHAPHFGQGSP